MLKHFWCKRNDLHICRTKFSRYRTEDTTTTNITTRIQQHTCVVIKTNIRTIRTADFFLCTHDNSFRNCTLFNITRWDHALNSYDNHITYCCITFFSST